MMPYYIYKFNRIYSSASRPEEQIPSSPLRGRSKAKVRSGKQSASTTFPNSKNEEIRQPEDGEEKGSGSSSWEAAAPEIISFISSAGVLRDKQGFEQALTSVGLR